MHEDWIRETVAARAEERGLTAYAVAKAAGLDPNTVKRYLEGRCSLNSGYVSRICDVLGLVVRPGKRRVDKTTVQAVVLGILADHYGIEVAVPRCGKPKSIESE